MKSVRENLTQAFCVGVNMKTEKKYIGKKAEESLIDFSSAAMFSFTERHVTGTLRKNIYFYVSYFYVSSALFLNITELR